MPLIKQHVNEDDLLIQYRSLESTTEQTFTQKRPYISSSMCQRQIALNGLMAAREVERSPAMKYYAGIGNTIETIIVDNYRLANQLLIHSWKLPKELFPEGIDLGGKVDMIISHRGMPVLVDIKTVGVVDAGSYVNISPTELQRLEAGEDIIIVAEDNRPKATTSRKIKEAYLSQLQLYAAITGLDDIFLMSASRRVQDSFTSDGHMSTVFNRIEVPNEALKRRIGILLFGIMARDLGLEPSKLITLKKSHCSDAFCSFVNHCWNGSALEQNFEPMSEAQEKVLKIEAMNIAEKYITERASRRDITLQLMQVENKRRQEIEASLEKVKKESIEPLTKAFGLYPWDIDLKTKW